MKKDKGTDYVLSLKSKGAPNSKSKPLYTDFLNNMKLSRYRVGINFDNVPLAIIKQLINQNCQEILLTISNLIITYLEKLI